MNYTGNDCAWNPLEQAKNLIATAATNGAVVIWNIVRDGQTRQEMISTEHTRAVNRVSWHPESPQIFLTGSQDGLMKLWDMREKANSKITFNGHAESVRDVQFSPFYPNYFAAGFDNGNVQIWDIRKPGHPKDLITAHQALVLTVDWHPDDKNLLATGGRDRMVKVWDLTQSGKGQSVYSIQTISSVARVKWRPGHRYHVASCASLLDFRVHIWDVRHPYIPIGGLVGHRDVATGLIWPSGHTLLSCSKDATVILHDTALAERPATTVRTAALSWSVFNELSSANDPIIRADIHNLSPSTIPAPPPLFSSSSKGEVSIFSTFSSFKELGPSFDANLFVYFAQSYKLTDATLSDLCEHNSDVATKAQQHQIAQVWQLIKLFYDSEFDPDQEVEEEGLGGAVDVFDQHHFMPLHHSTSSNASDESDDGNNNNNNINNNNNDMSSLVSRRASHISNHELYDQVLMDDKSNDFDLHDPFLRSEAVMPLSPLPLRTTSLFKDRPSSSSSSSSSHLHSHLHRLSSAHPSPPLIHDPLSSPSLIQSPLSSSHSPLSPLFSPPMPHSARSLPPVVDMWGHGDMILQLLEHFAERGDVQTCVAITTVLGPRLEVPKNMFLRWTTSYIELLQRHRLWTIANMHVKLCPEPQVSQTNQVSTTIHTGCAYCGKPLLQKGWACEKCKKLAGMCSVCQMPVKGMYAWCQGCGHGGHLAHMHEWFMVQGHKVCPAGCSHVCTFKPIAQR